MQRLLVIISVSALLAGCAPPRADGPSPEHGFNTFGEGVGQLLVSPLMIVAGLLEGIASLPYFIAADLHQMNRAMVDGGARVNLDRTYEYAYDAQIENVSGTGDTGKVFRHLSEATEHFQRVLRGYGVEDYKHYLLTGVRTADREGFTLYALVYRPDETIRVYDGRTVRHLRPADSDYYRPYARDANGRLMDVVIDWAGVPRTSIRTQKGQAILMTLAANSVLINRRSDEYWVIERRWVAGEYEAIVAERKRSLDKRMGLST
ncbi:MAG: hypothetical protein R3174_14385 [Gammaproteobacteria bacterium]|nr:hypothetical protein [Gammaproteobacteria bacterium]